MNVKPPAPETTLSVVIAVVSGKRALRRCLGALRPQIVDVHGEIIVAYDRWSSDVGELYQEFPEVRFHFIADGDVPDPDVSAHAHRLYDRRRAVGLALAEGRIVAMTEDHAVPADDWCRQVLAAHQRPHAVIGGAIENGIDKPMNRALYYCDFGRYGRPLPAAPPEYVSDVNVAYKRSALDATRALWRDAYHETTIHWALREQGHSLFLDPNLVVFQHRPPIGLRRAFAERMQWGRVFAETRAARGGWKRVGYAAGTPLLLLLLVARVLGAMRRHGRSLGQIATTLPLAVVLTVGWSIGELLGYIAALPSNRAVASPTEVAQRVERC